MKGFLSADYVWLLQAFLVALSLGLLLSLVVGLMLLGRPAMVFALNTWLGRWIDTGPTLKLLEQPHSVERVFYRHHRIVGGLIATAAFVVLWRWAFVYDRTTFMAALGRYWTANGLDAIVTGLECALVLLHVAILVVGIIVFVRPSMLKSVEAVANRWHAAPGAAALDAVVLDIESVIQANARLSGIVVTAASAISLVLLLPVLWRLLGR